MDKQNLNYLIQQVQKLPPIEQHLLLKALSAENEEPLTEKEKQFIQDSEIHINSLKETNKKLDDTISNLE